MMLNNRRRRVGLGVKKKNKYGMQSAKSLVENNQCSNGERGFKGCFDFTPSVVYVTMKISHAIYRAIQLCPNILHIYKHYLKLIEFQSYIVNLHIY